MKPRGFWKWLSIAATFLGLYMGAVSLWYHSSYKDPMYPWYVGWLALLIAGTITMGAYAAFRFEAKTISVQFENRESFRQKIKALLTAMKFEQSLQSEDSIVYKPKKMILNFFKGKVFIQLESASAKIAGPRFYIKKLEKEFES